MDCENIHTAALLRNRIRVFASIASNTGGGAEERCCIQGSVPHPTTHSAQRF